MSRFCYLIGRFSGVHVWPVLGVPRGKGKNLARRYLNGSRQRVSRADYYIRGGDLRRHHADKAKGGPNEFHGNVNENGLLDAFPAVSTIAIWPEPMSFGKAMLIWLAPSTKPGAMPAYRT